jgi:hypothetical protein
MAEIATEARRRWLHQPQRRPNQPWRDETGQLTKWYALYGQATSAMASAKLQLPCTSHDYTCKQLGHKIHARKVLLHVRLNVAHSLIPSS